MANDLGQVKVGGRGRFEGVIESKLARAESRIRGIDCTTGILAFIALTLAYGLLAGFCDRLFSLSLPVRVTAFLAYLAGAGLILWQYVLLPLSRPINPLFAALKVEKTLPGSKNSVVNWLDLHDQPLAASIRSALAQRAAKDLNQADIDNAVSSKPASWLGGAVAVIVGCLFLLFLWSGPSPFFSLMRRAYAPFAFGSEGIATRTSLNVVTPEGGDATVNLRKPVKIAVQTDGREPESVTLEYRYHEKDRFMERPFQVDGSRTWTTTVPADEVQNGFYYRVKGGDAVTGIYQIRTRPNPVIERVQSFYHYRDYVGLAHIGQWPTVSSYRPIEALRGTRVVVETTTNRPLKEGRLEFHAQGEMETSVVRVKPMADRPQSFQAELLLDRPGTYQLGFTSVDGEIYTEPQGFSVTPVEDLPPVVEITAPLQDIRLPANGILKIDGKARDDVGVKAIVLHLRNMDKDEPELEGKIYQPEGGLDLASGGNPRDLIYHDFMELSALKTKTGKPYPARTGMELECWLEARDACDFPDPMSVHRSESKRFHVRLTEPLADKEQKKEKDQASEQQKQHEKQQKQDRQREDQDRQQRRQEEEKNAEQQKQAEGAQNQQDPNKQDPNKQDPNKQDPNKQDPNKQDANPQGGQPKGENQDPKPGEQNRDNPDKTAPGAQQGPNDKPQKETGANSDPKKEGGDPKAAQNNDPKKEGGDPKDAQNTTPDAANKEPSPEQQRKDEETRRQAQQLKEALDKKQQQQQKDQQPNQGERSDSNAQQQPAQAKPDPKNQKGNPNEKNSQGNNEAAQSKPQGQQGESPPPGSEKAAPKEEKNQPAPGEKKDAGQQGSRDMAKPPPSESKGKGDEPKNATKPENNSGGSKEAGSGSSANRENTPPKPGGKDENAGPGASQKADPKEAKPADARQAGRDLANDDPKKRQQAADQLKKMADQAKDPATQSAAKQELDKANLKPDGERKRPEPAQAKPQDAANAAQDLNNPDPKKSEQAANDLKEMSEQAKDPKTREAAKKELDRATKPQSADAAKPDPKEAKPKDADQAGQDLKSDDPKKRQEALDKLKQMKQEAKDPATRQAAEKKLEENNIGPDGERKRPDPKEAKPQDVANAGQDAKSDDPKKQQQAKKDLEDIKAEAKDPETRAQAEEALKKLKQQEAKADSPESTKQKRDLEKQAEGDNALKKEFEDLQSADAAKRAQAQKDLEKMQHETDDAKKQDLIEQMLRFAKNREDERRRVNDVKQQPLPPAANTGANSSAATELQLEDFSKIDKDILKDLKMSEDELKKLKADWQNLRQRQEAASKSIEKPVDPKNTGTLGSSGGKVVEGPGTPGTAADAKNGGRLQPPPGYRDPYREFNRRMSTPPPPDTKDK